MTRETKIGLLVGLAFIVVFAMLLSHSGPTAPPGDVRQLTRAKQSPAPSLINEPTTEIDPSPIASYRAVPEAPTVTEGSPTSTVLQPPEPSESDAPDDLPTPRLLDPNEPPGTEQPPLGIAEAEERGSLESLRIAPSPGDRITAEPSVRDIEPSSSEPPTLAENAPDHRTPDTGSSHAGTSDRTLVRSGREHVIQKGEYVLSILKSEYGASSQRIIDAFRAANTDIKDIHKVIEGQKVTLPALAPEAAESANSGNLTLDAAERAKEADLARMERLINEPRKAPNSATRLADSAGGRGKVEKIATQPRRLPREARVYEVQTKDTFSSIAKEQLGSETLWKEIQRLNPKVDPAKMRPGTKLKLPNKRPLADVVAAGGP